MQAESPDHGSRKKMHVSKVVCICMVVVTSSVATEATVKSRLKWRSYRRTSFTFRLPISPGASFPCSFEDALAPIDGF